MRLAWLSLEGVLLAALIKLFFSDRKLISIQKKRWWSFARDCGVLRM